MTYPTHLPRNPEPIVWGAYEANGYEPDLDAVGMFARPVTVREWMRLRRVIRETVPAGPPRFATYFDGLRMVTDEDVVMERAA